MAAKVKSVKSVKPEPKLKAKKQLVKKVAKKEKVEVVQPVVQEKKLDKKVLERHLPKFHSFVTEFFGDNALRVVNGIKEDGCTDDVIERKSGLKMPEIRSLLNRLHGSGVVEYAREKNLESGWFTYTWRVNYSRAVFNFLQEKKRELDKIKEDGLVQKFSCGRGCTIMPFVDAVEQQFKCPACEASMLEEKTDSQLERKLETQVKTLEQMAQELL